MDIDANVALTKRECLQEAQSHLSAVVLYCLDLQLTPDKVDCDHIREAFRLVQLALKDG